MEAEEVQEGVAEARGDDPAEAQAAARRLLLAGYPGLVDAELSVERDDEAVRVTADLDAWEQRGFALPEAPAERINAILEQVLASLDLPAVVEISETEDVIVADIQGEDLGLLIGRRGQTLDALQRLCFQAAFQGTADRKRVELDAEGYRDRRRESLQRRADEAADRALETGDVTRLEPMSPAERRIVHERLRDREGLDTHSEGQEPERRLVITPLRGG